MFSLQSAGVPRVYQQVPKPREEPGHQFAKASDWGVASARMGTKTGKMFCAHKIITIVRVGLHQKFLVWPLSSVQQFFSSGKGPWGSLTVMQEVSMLYPPLKSLFCHATCLRPLHWPKGGVTGKLPKVSQHWPENTAFRRRKNSPGGGEDWGERNVGFG